jgi:hypothetical protein
MASAIQRLEGPHSHKRRETQGTKLLAVEVLMNRLLGIFALALLFCLPAFAQAQRMAPDDQGRFNDYYSRWMQDRQSNDRDDMISMEHHMQDLMNKYAIPPDTPYGEVAAQNATPRYDRDHDDRDRGYAGSGYGRVQMSSDDQRKFNDEYRKWQESTAKNDRDDIDKHARKMEEIMARYNIPPRTAFDEIATTNGYDQPRNNYRDFQGRLSPDDQQKFDKTYDHWRHERSENDRNGMAKEEGKMQEIMARYNIPRDVPYDAIASGNRGY